MKAKDDNIKNLFGSLKKDYPFGVPENYFETFAERLNNRIEEEELRNKRRSLFVTLNPILKFAAVLAVAMLLVYVPYKKYFPSVQENLVQNSSINNIGDSTSAISGYFMSNFTEEQFISAFADMDILESKTLSSEKLGDYITANFSEYDILTNN